MQLMEDVWHLRSKRTKHLHPAFKQALGSSSPRVAKQHAQPRCSIPNLSGNVLTPRFSAG